MIVAWFSGRSAVDLLVLTAAALANGQHVGLRAVLVDGKLLVKRKEMNRLLGAVVDSMVKCGVTMLPTGVVYEANRDVVRATSLPWHAKYTHQALLNWNYPNPAFHGAFHYDWTSDDEAYWSSAYELWGKLIFEFNKRGGKVAYGTDDNYIWATPGFSSVRELQLLRETGVLPQLDRGTATQEPLHPQARYALRAARAPTSDMMRKAFCCF